MIRHKINNLLYPELSYTIVGLCFSVHNEIGPYGREKQYCDLLEKKLKEIKLAYKRELCISDSGNILDFLIDNKIALEAKTQRVLTKDDYYQVQRYLQSSGIYLGILINFRSKHISPKRIIKLDKSIRSY